MAHKTVYLVSKLGSIVAFKTDAHTPRKTSVWMIGGSVRKSVA